MIKTILLPMGTSKSSRASFKLGTNIANLLKSTLRVLLC